MPLSALEVHQKIEGCMNGVLSEYFFVDPHYFCGPNKITVFSCRSNRGGNTLFTQNLDFLFFSKQITNNCAKPPQQNVKHAESVDRTRDLKFFSLTPSQLSYFGL